MNTFIFQHDDGVMAAEKNAIMKIMYSELPFPVARKRIFRVSHNNLQDQAFNTKSILGDTASPPIPIGSVEFTIAYMRSIGIPVPRISTYPDLLSPFLRREISIRKYSDVSDGFFIKPLWVKKFTGHIKGDSEYSRETRELDDNELVICSSPVKWLCEYRYYVVLGKIVGDGRYDEEDNDITPDLTQVAVAAAALYADEGVVSCALDFGVLDDGQTALVERNDAWAIGYYKGSLSERAYVDFISKRWNQITT